MNDYLEHHGIKGMRWGVRRRRPQQVLGGDEYRRGLRRATLTTGLIGRAMYKRKYKTNDVAKPTVKVKRKSAVPDEYKKGLRRATLEGGLIGRAMYKRKAAKAKASAAEEARRREGAREDAQSYKYNKSGESGRKGMVRAIKANTTGADRVTKQRRKAAVKGIASAALLGGTTGYTAGYAARKNTARSAAAGAALGAGAYAAALARSNANAKRKKKR